MDYMHRIAGTVGAAIDIYESLAEFFNANKGALGGDFQAQSEIIARVIFVGIQAFETNRYVYPEEIEVALDEEMAAIGALPPEQRMIATVKFLYSIHQRVEELCE